MTVKSLRAHLASYADDLEIVLQCEHSAYDAHAAYDISRVRNGYLVLAAVAGARGNRSLLDAVEYLDWSEEDGL